MCFCENNTKMINLEQCCKPLLPEAVKLQQQQKKKKMNKLPSQKFVYMINISTYNVAKHSPDQLEKKTSFSGL